VLVGSAVSVSAIHVEDRSRAVASTSSALKPPSVHADSRKPKEQTIRAKIFFNVTVLGKLLFL